MAIFNSKLFVYQSVYPIDIPLNHYKIPFKYHELTMKFHDFFVPTHIVGPIPGVPGAMIDAEDDSPE